MTLLSISINIVHLNLVVKMLNRLSYSLLFVLLISVLVACQPMLLDPTFVDSAAVDATTAADSATDSVGALARSGETVALMLSAPNADSDRPASDIYAEISPAVAFVETLTATGSGVLLEHGYLLTNAHVVWPYEAVRVVFPDGSEHVDVPVFAMDLVADLALVGPIDTELAPVPLVDGSDLEIGGDVYLIGYPAELEAFPQPSITSGILSRVRRWDAIDLPFFQVDATITGGQSGGIMVTHRGDVIGISTFYYSGFGLASSVADALPRLNAMLAQDEDFASGVRPVGRESAALEHEGLLHNEWDERTYILRAPVGTDVEIRAEGAGRPRFTVSALLGGFIDESSADEANVSGLAFSVDEEIDYLITVRNQLIGESGFTLTTSHAVVAFEDPDDGAALVLGERLIGSMDSPEDVDYFELTLAEGDRVQITVDALGLDPNLALNFRSETAEEVVFDDNSGGGIFGQSAQIIYRAPKDGTYTLVVQNYEYGSVGGYFLSATAAPSDAKLTEIEVSRAFLSTRYGRMSWYQSDDYDFQMLRPAQWQEPPVSQCGEGATACFTSEIGGLIISEEEFSRLPDEIESLDDYVDLMSELMESNLAGFELVSLEILETRQDLDAAEIVFTTQDGQFKVSRLLFVDVENQVGFNASFYGSAENHAIMEPFIDYVFNSFRFWNAENRESYALYFLDQSVALRADGQDEAALDALTKAIEVDPNFIDAYTNRAWLQRSQGNDEGAIADMASAIAIEPENPELFYTRGQLQWFNDNHEAALVDIDAAIALDDGLSGPYNQRALINASLGEYETALEDVKKSARANKNELSTHVRDTRAYVYLKMGNFVRAKADYDKLFRQEFRSPYSLLGGAIAYDALGDTDTALGLIAEALSALGAGNENPDPQMEYLLEVTQGILDGG